MSTFMLIINIVILLVAILLIVSVLMQQGNRAGLGAIGGGAETFFGKSKAKSYEGKLELITKISAAVFTILVIVLAATYNRYGGTSSTSNVVLPTVAPVEATVAPATSAAADASVAPAASVAADITATAAPTVAAEAAATPAAALATEAPAASPAA
jgi:preprotein translocase subunit SecG